MTLVIHPFKCFTMRRINLLSGILWCLIFTLSCTSENSHSPEVNFINPELNSYHDLTHELEIEIDISDDFMIMEYKFWLESSSGFEIFSEEKKVNKDNYKILYRFDLSHNIKEYFSIHLEVKDNDGNKTYKSMKISTF